MVTGRSLFSGRISEETLRAVMERGLDLDALPSTVPESIRKLIGRCLTKNPRYRLQAIVEARIVIEYTRAESEIRRRSTADVAVRNSRPRRRVSL